MRAPVGRSTLSEERVERRLTTIPAGGIAALFADNKQITSAERPLGCE